LYTFKKSNITYIASLFFSYKSILSFHIARRYFLPNTDLSKEMYEIYKAIDVSSTENYQISGDVYFFLRYSIELQNL